MESRRIPHTQQAFAFLENDEPPYLAPDASLPTSSMYSSPSTGASVAAVEVKSTASLPSTPWAELDPGEQAAERFDRLGNRVLEDSSDEEELQREEARDRLLDDENTEVTHDATAEPYSIVCS